MADVNLTRNNYAANGSVTAGTVDAVILTNIKLTFGVTVGVFKGETGSVVVSLNPSLSGTPGNANGGEPAYDGKDVFIPADAFTAASLATRLYVASTSGTVNYWVTAV